jgi:uncharacterized protein YjiS (DUF1127 family)
MLLIHWHETRSRPRQRNALFALNDAASHVLALLREWRRRSKERTQFAKLDDRMLKDIGLTRTDGEFLLSCALQSWIARSERTYGSKPFEYYGGFPLF